jgi:hypothetical protein
LEQAGMVLCQLRDCPKPECENPIRTRDDCCPVCPGEISLSFFFSTADVL